jgi:hypothetical protein
MPTDFRALQAYKQQQTDASTRAMSMGSWRANLAKGGVLHTPSAGGSKGPKKLGKSKVMYPPAEGWTGGNPDTVKSFTSPQQTYLYFDKDGYVIRH